MTNRKRGDRFRKEAASLPWALCTNRLGKAAKAVIEKQPKKVLARAIVL
jgi:hypothetical protein